MNQTYRSDLVSIIVRTIELGGLYEVERYDDKPDVRIYVDPVLAELDICVTLHFSRYDTWVDLSPTTEYNLMFLASLNFTIPENLKEFSNDVSVELKASASSNIFNTLIVKLKIKKATN